MNIFKQRKLYTNTLLTFLVIVLIDLLVGAGLNLSRGSTFAQTIENYKIPYSYLGVAFTIVYINIKKQNQA